MQLDPNIQYCFEDPRAAEIVKRVHGDARIVAASELVFRHVPDMRPQNSDALFESLLKPSQLNDARSWLHTIRVLRETFMVAPEDFDFCFSILPATPKNSDLRLLLSKYLASDLKRDWMFHVSVLIEALKQPDFDAVGGRWHFVRALDSTHLFEELSKAFSFSPHVEEAALVDSWELLPTTKQTPVLCGSPPRSLAKLAERVARVHEREKATIYVTFHAPAQSREYFALLLERYGLSLDVRFADPSASLSVMDYRARTLEWLRQDRGLEMKRRLELGQVIVDKTRATANLHQWEKAVEKLGLPEADLLYLRKLSPCVEPPPKKGDVCLLPFHPYPLPRERWLAYTDIAYLIPDSLSLILRPTELESLHQAGFPVPRARSARSRREEILREIKPRWLVTQEWEGKHYSLSDEDVPAPSIAETTLLPLGQRTLSATQLETYSTCPSRYFYSKVLRLQKNDGDTFALHFGQCVHKALEEYFKLREKSLTEYFDESLKDVSDKSLHFLLRNHFNGIEKKVETLEAKLLELFPVKAKIGFEIDFDLNIGGARLRGKIDRVDELESGDVLVLDYKTGNVDFSPEHMREGANFQALVYWLAVEQVLKKRCVGVLFYDLKKAELKRGLVDEEFLNANGKKLLTRGHAMPKAFVQKILSDGEAKLRELTRDIEAGKFAATPSGATCRNCDYAAHCREGNAYA